MKATHEQVAMHNTSITAVPGVQVGHARDAHVAPAERLVLGAAAQLVLERAIERAVTL